MSNSHMNPTLAKTMGVVESNSKVRGAPKQSHVGRATYDALMAILSEERESPTSPLGVFVANSTKRAIKKQMESLIKP